MSEHSISVFGLGYVGLATAVCFADRGFKVFGVDVEEEKVRLIGTGQPPIYEPGLRELLAKSVEKGLLNCTLSHRQAILETAITFVTVGTPSKLDGSIDLTSIEEVSRQIGEALGDKNRWHLVVVKSTVIPCTTSKVVKPIIEKASGKKCGVDWGLCMNPEFLREGAAIQDTLEPNRIIIGEHDRKSGDVLESSYRDFYMGRIPVVLRMNLASAEMVKYASNAFLATKISFINQIANLCEKIEDVDIGLVKQGMGLDDRIGAKFLNAGPGFGGSCFGKDLNALIAFSDQVGCDTSLLRTVLAVNARQALHIVDLVKDELHNLDGRRIAILGLSFKADTDDVRDSASIRVIDGLLREKASVTVYDPASMKNARLKYEDKVSYADSAIDCLVEADCAIVLTEWDVFKKLKPDVFRNNMRRPFLIDSRRIYNPAEFTKAMKYVAIGLGSASESKQRNETCARHAR
jgi:UDPglucose 6-dehydrogenase